MPSLEVLEPALPDIHGLAVGREKRQGGIIRRGMWMCRVIPGLLGLALRQRRQWFNPGGDVAHAWPGPSCGAV